MKALHLAALGAGAVGVLLFVGMGRKALSAAGDYASTALNPVSDQNLAYQGANAVVRTLPGAESYDTLGTWLHKTFSGDDERVAAMLASQPVRRTSDAAAIQSTAFTGGATGSW